MGMSASQARYLQLTARKSDLEYQAQQICQQRLNLADKTQAIATEYTEKMNDRQLYFVSPLSSTSGTYTAEKTRLTYSDIVRDPLDEENPGMGMRLVNSDGKIISPYIPEGEDPENYEIDLNCLSADYLEKQLRNGDWMLQKKVDAASSTSVDGLDWVDVNYYTDSHISDDLYVDNDSAAQAEYTRDSQTIQKQDKALEMRLEQITTQQKSLETEMDSVKKVIDKNIEGSFKTFG